jgi:hypothetical protein
VADGHTEAADLTLENFIGRKRLRDAEPFFSWRPAA